MSKEDESVAFAGRIALSDEESVHEFRRIRNEIFEFTVDGIEGETAFLRTQECRCSRHKRQVGIKGSKSSASFAIFCKKRKLAPRIYSLGCCWIWYYKVEQKR